MPPEKYHGTINAIMLFIFSFGLNTYACKNWIGKAHSNGGGFVHHTAKVAKTAFVSEDSMVCGFTKVFGNARIEEGSTVTHNAQVLDNVVVKGGSFVGGNSKVSGNVVVDDGSKITGSANVFGGRMVSGEELR